MCVRARGFKLCVTCKFYLHWSGTTEVSVFDQYKLQTADYLIIASLHATFDELMWLNII